MVARRRQAVVEGLVVEVAAVVGDPLRERLPDAGLDGEDPAELVERGPQLGPKGLIGVRAAPDREEGELVGQEVRPPQLEEGRHDLAMGKVTGRAEEDEDGRVRHPLQAEPLAEGVAGDLRRRLLPAAPGKPQGARRHRLVVDRAGGRRRAARAAGTCHRRYSVFTAWPPNSLRRAARTLAP